MIDPMENAEETALNIVWHDSGKCCVCGCPRDKDIMWHIVDRDGVLKEYCDSDYAK